MSRRKHVTLGLRQDIDAPTESQCVVQVVGTRGGNIVEVAYPDGRQTLCLIPSKFNKKLWVKRGGYLLVEDAHAPAALETETTEEQPANGTTSQEPSVASLPQPSTSQPSPSTSMPSGKVTATIIAVLYDEHIRQLKKMPGAWPAEFLLRQSSSLGDGLPSPSELSSDGPPQPSLAAGQEPTAAADAGEGGEDSDSDSGLPALERNTNRKIIEYEDDESTSDDEQ